MQILRPWQVAGRDRPSYSSASDNSKSRPQNVSWNQLLTRIANFFNLGTQIFLFLTSKDPHGAEKWDYADSIPGIAGQNYPILSQPIGATSFNCKGRREGGYYADVDSACQV